MNDIELNVRHIEDQLKTSLNNSRRDRVDLRVIVVTKYVSVEQAAKVVSLGYKNLGENRPEGLIEKQEALKDEDIVWHFIGSLQSRKVKEVINRIDYLHSLDRLSLAKEIEKRAEKTIPCFVQVNVSGEDSKSGVSPNDLEDFIISLSAFSKIRVIGLMTMAPIDADETAVRDYFKNLKELQEKVAQMNLEYAPCTELSMGMSQDYPVAIEEGATFIRVGSAFFKENEQTSEI